MIAILRRRRLVPALSICVLAAAVFAPSVGAGMHTFPVTAFPGPCTAVSLSAAPPSGQYPGHPVVFTATGTCPNIAPMYEFWMRTASQPDWVMIQSYSTSNIYNWDSTGAAPGIVYFGVWVKDLTSSTSSFDKNASIPFTENPLCPGPTTVSASPTTVVAGVHSTLTGSTTCARSSPLYKFWLRTATSDWFLAREYSPSATYDWNSTQAPAGTIYFGLWVKDALSLTSTFDANASTTVTVTPPCTLSASAAPTTVVHGVGTHVIVTAVGSCTHPSPQYQFWLRTTNTAWQLVQGYSTTATYDWNSTGAPITTVYIGVWVKDASGTTASFDVNVSVTIPVT